MGAAEVVLLACCVPELSSSLKEVRSRCGCKVGRTSALELDRMLDVLIGANVVSGCFMVLVVLLLLVVVVLGEVYSKLEVDILAGDVKSVSLGVLEVAGNKAVVVASEAGLLVTLSLVLF